MIVGINCGDVNIHLDDALAASTSAFCDILDCADLVQHVAGPTHQARHTLDVVITPKATFASVSVEMPSLADNSNISPVRLLSSRGNGGSSTSTVKNILSVMMRHYRVYWSNMRRLRLPFNVPGLHHHGSTLYAGEQRSILGV